MRLVRLRGDPFDAWVISLGVEVQVVGWGTFVACSLWRNVPDLHRNNDGISLSAISFGAYAFERRGGDRGQL